MEVRSSTVFLEVKEPYHIRLVAGLRVKAEVRDGWCSQRQVQMEMSHTRWSRATSFQLVPRPGRATGNGECPKASSPRWNGRWPAPDL